MPLIDCGKKGFSAIQPRARRTKVGENVIENAFNSKSRYKVITIEAEKTTSVASRRGIRLNPEPILSQNVKRK